MNSSTTQTSFRRTALLLFAAGMSAGYLLGGSGVFAQKNETPDPSKNVATVGKATITVADLEAKVNEVPEYLRRNFMKVDGKKKLLDNLVKGEILYQAAVDAGYDKDAEIQKKIDETRRSIYQSEYFKREVQNAVVKNEERARKYYEDNKDKYRIHETRRSRHIMVKDRALALDIKAKLDAGGSWKDLSSQYNEDINTRESAGYLGYQGRAGVINGIGDAPEVNSALFSAKLNEVVGPVKSKFGYHIVQVDDIHPESYQPFDQVKADINDLFLVTDEMIKAEYEKTKAEHINRENVGLAQILTDSEEKANDILKKLNAGEDWDALCRVHSLDTSTATKRGDIGLFYKGGTVKGVGQDPALEAELLKMRPGQTSGVLKSRAGYHIFRCTSYSPESQKSLAEVDPLLRTKLLRNARENLLESEFDRLSAKYGVKVFEENIVDTSWMIAEPATTGGSGTAPLPFPFAPTQN